jgi:deoxyuridine 5'-triphosphate nucleotidohydrolase
VSDVIRSLHYDGIKNVIVPIPDRADSQQIQRIEFVNDIINKTVSTTPFSIRYYTQQSHVGPTDSTIPIQVQIDGGANRSITSRHDILHRFKTTTAYPIYGVNKEDVALQCTGRGYLPWVAENGDTLYVPMFYSPDAAETIISPTDVVMSHHHLFCAWAQFSHCTTGQGHVTFYRTEGTNHTSYPLTMRNGLWYHNAPKPTGDKSIIQVQPQTTHVIIHRLNNQCQFELWHNRFVHSCKQKVLTAHKHIKGVPKLKGNPFFQCASCNHAKPKRRSAGEPQTTILATNPSTVTMTDLADELDYLELIAPEAEFPDLQIRQMFYMDFGFPRGKTFQVKDDYGRLITSFDGYRAYLLIIDRKSRYIWIMLAKTKQPPIHFLKKFFSIHGLPSGRRIVRTDKGGELWGSYDFRQTVLEANYLLEPTAPAAAFQNALAERPNQTLGNWMRCILHAANLGPEFWSFALIHVVKVYNMLPHSSTGMTPYYALTDQQPDGSNLRIFGCQVYVRKPGDREHKLDLHTVRGIFLGFTATDKNIHYFDRNTKQVKTATHVVFDEANYTLPKSERPPASQALIDLGYTDMEPEQPATTQSTTTSKTEAKIKLLTPEAKTPTRGTPQSVGYDVYSPRAQTLQPQMVTKVPLDITIVPPAGTYIQLMSRSGLSIKGITCHAGVIDPDYRGNITALLYNSTDKPFPVKAGDRVAQLLFKQVSTPELVATTALSSTDRADKGFGSTDIIQEPSNINPPQSPYVQPDKLIIRLADEESPSTEVPATETRKELPEMPYNIYLSTDPFDDVIPIAIKDFGSHTTMGMVLENCPVRNRPKLVDILHSNPASRIKRWRSTIKNSYITQIDEHPIDTIDDVIQAIQTCRQQALAEITIEFAVDIKPSGIHPTEGIPMLFSDQLNVIAKYITEIKEQVNPRHEDQPHVPATIDTDEPVTETANLPTGPIPAIEHSPTVNRYLDEIFHGVPPIVRHLLDITYDDPLLSNSTVEQDVIIPIPEMQDGGQKFTPKQIRESPDYPLWRQSQFQQLDMYDEQGMFGKPQQRQCHMNVWKLLWTYIQKPHPDNRLKARCVVNGSKHARKAAQVGHTFANSLGQDSERLFWALAAKLGLLVIGADVSNAFAEAPTSDNDLYVQPDDVFRDWWNHKKRPPIPAGWVIKIQYAFQGHPEAPRLWERHIDGILQERINLKPTHHEPCLYSGKVQGTYVLLLRQVDDFAAAVTNETIGKALIDNIDQYMRIRIKYQGQLTMFNGMDIVQTRHYIKLHCGTYLRKALGNHSYLVANAKSKVYPVPYPADHAFTTALDTAIPPATEAEQRQLSQHMNINYRQVIGLWIWPMIKCRPDVSFHISKLSQSLANPAKEHYEALKLVSQYLAMTIEEGLYFWRDKPRDDLTEGPMPTTFPDQYKFQLDFTALEHLLYALSDSDWASCKKTRNAITGALVMLAGAAIGYKTKFQKAVALSSTEAEWVAACEVGKMILYFRSLLEDLGQPQHSATIMFEDNRGALFMANAQQASTRTRHIDIKHFALVDWVEQDLMILEEIASAENSADSMTKATGKILFYRHMDTIMGRRKPKHVQIINEPKIARLLQHLSNGSRSALRLSRGCQHKTMGG